jgi:hypothetical protein
MRASRVCGIDGRDETSLTPAPYARAVVPL